MHAPLRRTHGSFRPVRYALVFLVLCALSGAARSQTCTFSVGYTDFGSIDVTDTEPADIVGGIHILCSGYSTAMVRMCLNIGHTDSRTLIGPSGATLNYNLYVDPDHQGVWGSVTAPDTVPLTLDLPVHPGGKVWEHEPFYGRIPPNQPVPNGTYTMPFSASDTYFVYVGYTGTPPDCKTATAPYTSGPFTVTATVGPTCTIDASPLVFREASLLDQPIEATSSLRVTCVSGMPFSVALDRGMTPGATTTNRKLARQGGTETIDYQLYIDPTHKVPWADGTNGTTMAFNTGTGQPQTLVVYGQVPAQESKPPGRYRDTIMALIVF
ncbi:spore coat protein U domain-containing protein [Caballeronia sp. LP006]|uniref:Csu type fimbrial protein n=1 Tax=unclassified Caballeronia TaxID=2646786 RepID=UPI00202797EA|nr:MULTISPECIES: spore coat protein U domain-containing protein [unclassified Caballeronia]MDR5830545.1 spore coat protein U domain-containing protein [Caballeronia sp. LP006]